VETVVPLQHGCFDGLAAGACDHERIIVLCPGPGEIGRQAGTDDGAENAAGWLAGACWAAGRVHGDDDWSMMGSLIRGWWRRLAGGRRRRSVAGLSGLWSIACSPEAAGEEGIHHCIALQPLELCMHACFSHGNR
jgi:hypothetical protein